MSYQGEITIESGLVLSNLLAEERKFKQALDHITTLRGSWPDEPRLIEAEIRLLLRAKQNFKALKMVDDLALAAPGHPAIQNLTIEATGRLARKRASEGMHKKALELWRSAARLSTDSPIPMLEVAWCHARLDEIKEAQSIIDETRTAFPDNFDVEAFDIRLCIRTGQYDDAQTRLAKLETGDAPSAKINPLKVRLSSQLGYDAVAQSDWRSAQQHWSTVVTLDPGNTVAKNEHIYCRLQLAVTELARMLDVVTDDKNAEKGFEPSEIAILHRMDAPDTLAEIVARLDDVQLIDLTPAQRKELAAEITQCARKAAWQIAAKTWQQVGDKYKVVLPSTEADTLTIDDLPDLRVICFDHARKNGEPFEMIPRDALKYELPTALTSSRMAALLTFEARLILDPDVSATALRLIDVLIQFELYPPALAFSKWSEKRWPQKDDFLLRMIKAMSLGQIGDPSLLLKRLSTHDKQADRSRAGVVVNLAWNGKFDDALRTLAQLKASNAGGLEYLRAAASLEEIRHVMTEDYCNIAAVHTLWHAIGEITDTPEVQLKLALYSDDPERARHAATEVFSDENLKLGLLPVLKQVLGILKAAGRFDCALHCTALLLDNDAALFKHVYQIDARNSYHLLVLLCTVQQTQSNYDHLIRLSSEGLDCVPNDIPLLCFRAQANFVRENYADAERDINAALDVDATDMRALAQYFKLMGAKRQFERCAAELDELVEEGIVSHAEGAQLALSAHMHREARRLFNSALLSTPGDKELAKQYLEFAYSEGYWGVCAVLFASHPHLRTTQSQIADLVFGLIEKSGLTLAQVHSEPERLFANNAAFDLIAKHVQTPAITRLNTNPASKKLALVIGSLGSGGAERQCSVLVRKLARDPERFGLKEVRLFCAKLSHRPSDRFLLPTIQEVGINPVEYLDRANVVDPEPEAVAYLRPKYRQQVMLQLREALQQYRPDVVHGWLDESIVNACLATLQLGQIPFVGRWGSMPPGHMRQVSQRVQANADYLKHAYNVLIDRHRNAKFYSNSIKTSEGYAEWLEQRGNPFGVIYNGLDLNGLRIDRGARAEIRAELNADADTTVIGTAIRFSEEKRPEVWLDVADALAKRTPNVRFVMVGDGPLLDAARKKAAQLEHAQVLFPGRRSDMNRWWSAFDIGMMTSSVEGVSNTAIEAQAYGRPMLAFDVGGMSEAVKTGVSGHLLRDMDVAGLVDALQRLAEAPEVLRGMGRAAMGFAAERFGDDAMAQTTVELYQQASLTPLRVRRAS